MAGEWREARLADVCREVRYGYTASATDESTGTRLLRVTDIAGGSIDWKTVPYCKIDEANFERYRLEPGDLVIARMGTIGVSALIREPIRAVAASYLIRHRVDETRADARFLGYVLRSPSYWDFVWSHGGAGAVQPNINAKVLGEFCFRLPTIPEQRGIAYILGTLDDKIELNRRMSETLEAMARALFKSWFVDFDPVRAKAEGRDPGLPTHLADLFPARLVDSELGEIPEGWEVKSLDQIARFLNGLALQKHPPVDGRSLPVIKIAQLRSGNTDGADRASADLESDYVVWDGDILFSWSGSLECRLWAGGSGALNQHLFKVSSDRYPRWLCYLGIHQHLDDFRHIAAGKATTMGHIQRHHLSGAKLAVPPPGLLRAMGAKIEPIIESTWRHAVQSRTLAAVRDAMLPKLISGELRVMGAERIAAGVAA